MKLKILLTSISLLASGCMHFTFAQVPLDLKSALRYTIDHHSTVKNAQIDVEKGRQMIREALSQGLPQVNATANLINNPALRTSLVPAEFLGGQPGEFARLQFGTNWNANAGIQLEQLLFSKTWLLGLEATREAAEFYEMGLGKSKEDVIYEVARFYYQIQLNQTQRGILLANLDQIIGLVTVTRKQFENGFAKKIDVDRLRVQQSNLQTQITNLDLQIGQQIQALKFAMQMPLDTEILLTDTISENSLKDINPVIAQPSFQNRPMLNILKKQQELYKLDERRWKAGYFPTLAFFANYNYEWQANNFSDFTAGNKWTDFSQIGLAITVPIFDGFNKDSKVQTARLNAMQFKNQYSLAELGYQLQHEAAVTTLRVNQNNLAIVKETRRVAEEVYRVALNRFKEGIAPVTELLDAETSMRQAQTNYITTLAQIKLSEIELLQANGQLINLID